MTSVNNCRPGELVITAPQCEIDKFVAEAKAEGITVIQNSPTAQTRRVEVTNYQSVKPTHEPLGVPVYNFEREPEIDRDKSKPEVVTNNRPQRGLGIPTYDF